MVAGDLVNTASRIQSAAEPGTVLVGEATKRATEAAIAYEDAGDARAEGQGRAGRALPRAARRRRPRQGALKSAGLEPPFVGRDRELRLVKELFHALRRGGARRTSSRSPGSPGSASRGSPGSSRSTSTGSRRTSAGTAAAASPTATGSRTGRSRRWCGCARGSSRTRTPRLGAREARRRDDRGVHPRSRGAQLVEPRLAHLLGLARRSSRDREDLFAAWRLFFERLAEHDPTVLVFEDMQWADASLLDFVEYLLEWSRIDPIFVAHPRAARARRQRPTWGAGHRNFTSLYLEPLSETAMDGAARRASCRASPEELREQILARAEGVPLYAVETVRMLLDRGLLVQEGESTGRRARSTRSRCPRRCTRSSPPASTACPRRSAACSRTPPCSARRSRGRRSRPVGRRRGRARAAPHLARAQGDPRRPGRSALAGARPVRLPPGPRPARRLRDALEDRSVAARHLAAAAYLGMRSPARTRSSRSSPRTTSTRTRGAPDADDAAEIKAKALRRRSSAPATARSRSVPRARPFAT